MLKLIRSSILLLMVVSLFTLTSCGDKKDTTESSGDKNTSGNTENSESNDNTSTGDIDMSSGEFKITYQMDGKDMKGTMTLYKMGEKFKTDMKADAGGMEGMTSMAISDGEYVYSLVDMMGTKKGIKMKIDDYSDKEDFGNMADVEEELSKYKVIGTETILGKECEIYETDEKGNTISVYNKKAVLKMKSPEMTVVATDFDTSPGLSDSDFKIPDDVEFVDMEEMLKGMKDLKNLENLKNLDPSKK